MSQKASDLSEHADELKQQIADLKASSEFQKLSREEQQSLLSGLEKSADAVSSDAETDVYKRQGWYTSKKYKKRIKTIPKGKRANYTLYAKWKKK